MKPHHPAAPTLLADIACGGVMHIPFRLRGIPSFSEIAREWSKCPGAASRDEIQSALYQTMWRGEFMEDERSFVVMVQRPEDRELPDGVIETFYGDPLKGMCIRKRKRKVPYPFMELAVARQGKYGVLESVDTRAYRDLPFLGWRVLKNYHGGTDINLVAPIDLPLDEEELRYQFIKFAHSDGEDPTQPEKCETDEFALVPYTPEMLAKGIECYSIIHGGNLPKRPENLARIEFSAFPDWAREHYLDPLHIKCEDLSIWYEAHGAKLGWPRPAWLPSERKIEEQGRFIAGEQHYREAEAQAERDWTEQERLRADCDETKAERCVREAAPPPRRGSYEVIDKPLVAEGIDGFLSGRWKSANDAAKELQSKAVGNSPESRRDRLQRQISAGIKKATGASPNAPEAARNIPNQPK